MLRSPRVVALSTDGRRECVNFRGYVPTLSVTLRFLIAPRAVWLQYVPEVAACIWAAWYFWGRRDSWNWLDQGSWVLLVSAACAPVRMVHGRGGSVAGRLNRCLSGADSHRALWPIAVLASRPSLKSAHWATSRHGTICGPCQHGSRGMPMPPGAMAGQAPPRISHRSCSRRIVPAKPH